MSEKFTKGPWGAVNNGQFWEVSTPWEVGEEIKKYCPSVAFVWALLPDADESGLAENQEANARLIAAAPELLESLEECLDHLYDSGTNGASQAIAKARAAIARAKGEA